MKARSTGRRTFRKKGRGGRFPNKRVPAQKWATTTLVARTLYPPLPAQMKLALRLHNSNFYNVNENAINLIGVSGVSPIGVGPTYPEGFSAMMRLYAHAIVDRVQVTWTAINFPANDAVENNRRPLIVTSLVMPWHDFNAGVAAFVADQYGSYPDSQTKIVAAYGAEGETVFHQSVDVRRALANPHEEPYACRSTPAGVITVPVLNAAIGASPMICLAIQNPDDVFTRRLLIRRDVVYHITFSMRHLASVGAAV